MFVFEEREREWGLLLFIFILHYANKVVGHQYILPSIFT